MHRSAKKSSAPLASSVFLPLMLAAAGLVLAVFANTSAAQHRSGELQTASTTPTGKILFGRTILNPDATSRSSSLFRVSADGSRVHQLTPKLAGIYHGGPSWSPGGGQIAYARSVLGKVDIHVMDSQGLRSRQITSGLHDFHTPAWGPGGTIAFIYDRPDDLFGDEPQSCVGTIRADGSQQQSELFCPLSDGSDPIRMNRVVWSADGNFLYVGAGYDGLTCDCTYLYTYRVDARTGARTLLALRAFYRFYLYAGGEPPVTFAPDFSHALYGGGFYDPYDVESDEFEGITRIDFASNQETRLVDDINAYAPLYSKDGSRIAFTRRLVSGDVRYDHLFVMNADGSNIRQLTTAPIDGLEYIAFDWSDDGKYLLVNRSIWQEDGTRRRAVRIIDVNTRAVTALPAQYVYFGAWFQPRQNVVSGDE